MQKLNRIGEHRTHTRIQNRIAAYTYQRMLHTLYVIRTTHLYAVIGAIFGCRNAQNPFKYFLDTQNAR